MQNWKLQRDSMFQNGWQVLRKLHLLKKSIKELEAKGRMLRCLAEPKKSMPQDYKCTMQNPHCVKRSDEILENENEQMFKLCQEAGLSLEQLHGQSKIQMAYAPKAWVVGKLIVDEKRFNNSTQTRNFHQWYLQQVKRGRLMSGFQYKHQHFYHGDDEQWIMWDEMCSLMKGDELGTQIICLWEL
jgi:hypothetical protein